MRLLAAHRKGSTYAPIFAYPYPTSAYKGHEEAALVVPCMRLRETGCAYENNCMSLLLKKDKKDLGALRLERRTSTMLTLLGSPGGSQGERVSNSGVLPLNYAPGCAY